MNTRPESILTAAVLALALAAPVASHAVVIDFEVAPAGPVPVYVEGDVTFTPQGGGTLLEPISLSFGRGIVGTAPAFRPIRADIAGGATFVSVVLGDDSPDQDQLFLEAYNASDVLIGSDSGFLPGTGFATLSVAAADIAYVIAGSVSEINQSSVIWDIFEYTPAQAAPAPGTLALLGLALAGVGRARQRRA